MVASSLADWFGLGRKVKTVSCNQNGGPFPQVDQPDINRADVNKKLAEFYDKCLKPEFEKGYLNGAINGNSESEAYALWQAYLAGDKRTFGKVLNWSKLNIRRDRDNLFSWEFEVKKRFFLAFWEKPIFATYKVHILDTNTATDADTDIAYVLLRAGTDWKNQKYIDEGKAVASDIWDKETAVAGDRRYVVAGNWAAEGDYLVVNPSYLSPQAYRTFALFDGAHDWNSVVVSSYDLLSKISDHGDGQPFVPPNWVESSKSDGSIRAYDQKNQSQDFGYDAFRAFWRVAQDQLSTPSFLSWNYISRANEFASDWRQNQQVCALYRYEGGGYVCDKSTTSTLAAPLGVFSVTNGYMASQLVQKYYIRDGKLQFPDTDFYAKSWHWFAAWLWAHS